jgi:hypothetical protein
MKKIIIKVLREEFDQTDDKKSSMRLKLSTVRERFGLDNAINSVGGLKNYIKIFYNGDLKKYYQESGFEPYRISDSGMIMYIDDQLVNYLELKDSWGGKEKLLGDFVYGPKGRVNYRFTAKVYGPFTSNNGQVFWKVVGTSGDSGFGYSHITQRNTLGKRARMQIFQQIIDKYNLDNYK